MAWLVTHDKRVLASAQVANSRSERRTGLLGRDGFDGALIIRARWIHTVGMRFTIDIAYVDADGVVIKTMHMKPNRVGVPVTSATWVIEAESGAFSRWGLHVGDVVEIRGDE